MNVPLAFDCWLLSHQPPLTSTPARSMCFAMVKSKFCATRELPAFARAGLTGAARRELHRARGRPARATARRDVFADCVTSNRSSLNTLLADRARVAHAQRVGDRVGGVGALAQIEIADAEIAALCSRGASTRARSCAVGAEHLLEPHA